MVVTKFKLYVRKEGILLKFIFGSQHAMTQNYYYYMYKPLLVCYWKTTTVTIKYRLVKLFQWQNYCKLHDTKHLPTSYSLV